jgi:SAM-dependent methyltransferase
MIDPIERYYTDYWRPDGFNPRGITDPVVESLLAQHTTDGDVVVEVGCGDGRKSGMWLSTHHRRYEGLDVSPSAVEAAHANGLAARVVPDAAATEVGPDSVDCVVCTEVLEHLFAPHEAAKEAARVLRDGGRYLVTVPNLGFWRRRVDLMFGRWNPLGDEESVTRPWRDPHIRFFTAATLARMLREAGFATVEVSGYGGGAISHLPYFSRRGMGTSHVYGMVERRLPSLLAYRLVAIATK